MFPIRPTHLSQMFAAMAVFALAGCGGTSAKKDSDKAPDADLPAFSEVNAVLTAKCAPCHAEGARHSNLVGHQETVDALAADIATRITSDDPKVKMPLELGTKPLTEGEKALFNAALGKAKTATYADLTP